MANEASKIGLDHVVIARLISDDANGVVYDTVKELKGAVNATVNPNSSVTTDYADNGAFFAVNDRGNTELALEMIDVDAEVLAEMLGQTKSGGVAVETSMDQSPYFAFGFRVWYAGKDGNGDNRYEYRWYAKGKFSVPEAGGSTKTETISFGHLNMTAQFVQTQFIPAGQESGTICTKLRTDDPTAVAATVNNWFNAPIISTSVDTSKLTVTAALSTGNVVFTGAKVSGASFKFVPASARLGDTIIVTDSSGELVKGTFTFSAASASPTITFTPDGGENTPATVAITSGLKDSFGVGATPMTDDDL